MQNQSKSIAGFFPGQGSQQVGMGKPFYDEFTVFRQVIEEASDSLNFNLKKLIFDGPEKDLTLTENAQPAILAVSTGCFRVAEMELGLETSVHLGHSLGEYSALVASEAIPFSDAVQWVNARGLAMQKAVPVGEGAMCAVIGAEDAQVDEWCKEAIAIAKGLRKTQETKYTVACTVEAANFNAPGQVVVSGSVDAVDAIENLITEKKIRGVMAKRLNVSAPFHSSLMKPARDAMDEIFANSKSKLNHLITPYIPNRTARITQEQSVVFELLSEQVDHSVLWKQSVEALFQQNYRIAFEFGPGKVLQGLAKRIAKNIDGVEFETHPIYDLETLKAAAAVLKTGGFK
jgi:[acyl-carrier-protein] S-malonyltransferase